MTKSAEITLREALKKDFRKLYVKEYTTTWEAERIVRELEIDIMSLDNTLASLPTEEEIRKQVAEEIKNWGNKTCPHIMDGEITRLLTHRECDVCWHTLMDRYGGDIK